MSISQALSETIKKYISNYNADLEKWIKKGRTITFSLWTFNC